MFDLEDFYRQAHSGNKVDHTEVIQYLKSYENIILWGASYLGAAVGAYLISQNVPIKNYWDIRHEEIGEVNGIQVIEPFMTEEKESTIVIYCIGNTAIMDMLLARLKEQSFHHVLRGDKLYMAVVCPFDCTTDIDPNFCNGTMCCRSMFCQRLHNIVKNRKNDSTLHIDNVTIMITTKCTLKCKYCVSYMNSYPDDKRYHVALEQMYNDIDVFFDTVDSVGSITIQGGEPFLHPDFSLIIKELLTKNNFGIISIATNGIVKLDPSKLDGLCDKRVNVSFSNYSECLSENQLEVFNRNIEVVRNAKIPYTVGLPVPEWQVPPALYNAELPVDVLIRKKQICLPPERCIQIMDGKLYPCLLGLTVHKIGLADYDTDYVLLDNKIDRTVMRESIQKFMDRQYYSVCNHCNSSGKTTPKAGEQGYMDFINVNVI